MDTSQNNFSFAPWLIALGIVIAVILGAYIFYTGRPTVPMPSYKVGFQDGPSAEEETKTPNVQEAMQVLGLQDLGQIQQAFKQLGTLVGSQPLMQSQDASGEMQTTDKKTKEGFFGGAARGAGVPDCTRSSAEGAALIAMFDPESKKVKSSWFFASDGSDDLRELTQIVSKLSCFKKDLVSPSHIVEATRYQQFSTSHDIEPIAETTGRCFAKTISPRDLEIAFDKWTVRGRELVSRLCTAFGLSSAEYGKAEKLFEALVRDVKDIARGQCLVGEPSIAGKPGPRDAHPYSDPDLETLGTYTGYY